MGTLVDEFTEIENLMKDRYYTNKYGEIYKIIGMTISTEAPAQIFSQRILKLGDLEREDEIEEWGGRYSTQINHYWNHPSLIYRISVEELSRLRLCDPEMAGEILREKVVKESDN